MKIIISVAVAFFLIACSEEGSQSSVKKDIVKEAVSVTQSAPEVVEEVKESTVEVAPVAVEVVADSVQVVLEESTEVVVTKSAADLFKACSSCHGLHGEKKALNKSQVIQGWSEVQVSTALNGYKDGSYGAAMKGLMKSQVTKLSDEDISVLAKHISEL